MSAGGRRVVLGPPDADDALVPVPAGQLLEWAHLLGWVSDGLGQAAETTRFDVARRLPDPVMLPQLIAALDAARERIGALLDGEGWWRP